MKRYRVISRQDRLKLNRLTNLLYTFISTRKNGVENETEIPSTYNCISNLTENR